MKPVLDIVLVIAIVADLAGNIWFLRGYFTLGIPAYRRRLPFAGHHMPADLGRYLTDRMRSSGLPDLVFRSLSDSEIGFREKVFNPGIRLRYTPVMHGLVEFSRAKRGIVITGKLNCIPLALLLLIISILRDAESGFVGVFVAFLAIPGSCYALQVYRYRAVVRTLSQHLGAKL